MRCSQSVRVGSHSVRVRPIFAAHSSPLARVMRQARTGRDVLGHNCWVKSWVKRTWRSPQALLDRVDPIVRTRTLPTCCSVSMERLTIAVLVAKSKTPRLKCDSDEVTAPGFTKCEGCLIAEVVLDPHVEQRNLLCLFTYPDKLYSQC